MMLHATLLLAVVLVPVHSLPTWTTHWNWSHWHYNYYDSPNYDQFIPFDYDLQEYKEYAKGLYPNVFNLATDALISVNATCGETGPEFYCRLTQHVPQGTDDCNVCDSSNPDQSKRHPIRNAIDGTDNWWQSPTLKNGKRYEWVTININLRQIYEVAYVVIKSAISPLPANWILERSVDGINFYPWQYFARTDTDCWERYRVRPTIGKVRYRIDDEVICTSIYSKADVLSNEEIHVSLINGRPGAESPEGVSASLRDFIKAQYIRIRMQKMRTLGGSMFYDAQDLDKADKTLTNRLFYSIKDITIGGQCMCHGHASECLTTESPNSVRGGATFQLPKCVCQHNTCGRSCDQCCPLFNQKRWRSGTKNDGAACEECQCHGHADECHFDQTVADLKQSINKQGRYEGGGVCVRCKHHTTGFNCEQCEDGYYRPEGVSLESDKPCFKCQCSGPGMSRFCVKDDTHLIEGRRPGDCLCREGFDGPRCDRCAPGFRNYPRCEQCSCVYAGIVNTKVCDGNCICKASVVGPRCNKCKEGYYNLAADNPEGCSSCYCFGATNKCKSSDWGIEVIRSAEGWKVTDVPGSFKLNPQVEPGRVVVANDEVPSRSQSLYYWEAPLEYLGQNLYSYGNSLKYVLYFVAVRGDTSGVYTYEPDVILEGGPDNIRIGYKWHKDLEEDLDEDEQNSTIILPLREQSWFRVDESGHPIPESQPSREEFTLLLHDMKRLLVRAKFHTDQVEGGLYAMDLEKASNSSKSIKKAIGTEHCDCPPGYAGLSCEYCQPGYRRVNNVLVNGVCEKCNCNNHAESCDPYTGACSECLHNTTGPTCGECKPGFYGDATRGQEDDCKPCACPLHIASNNFSPTCVQDLSAKLGYRCLECPEGYTGERCEICANGYFGNPLIPGGFCAPCDCGPNANNTVEPFCDHLTGQCLACVGNTGGWKCDECLPDHWGNAALGDCKLCNCNLRGSLSSQCNPTTGQCECKPNFTGLRCEHCAPGYGNLELDCPPCNCNKTGSVDEICNEVSGQCHCKPGVFGQHCDKCLEGHFGFSERGCEWCNCNKLGSEGPDCNEHTGQCQCKPFVTGRDCSHCEPGFWNLASNKGCEPCNCNITGSYSNVCNELSGQCDCKPGVGGLHCDQCLPGYYGFGPNGCSQCEPCDAPGHICDPKNGRCVCPPNTAGPTCNDCAPGTWGHDILTGCSPCDCNLQGSVSNECNHKTGECVCLDGFEGRHCEKCKFGYYRFPNCRRCDCHEPGTDPNQCRDSLCQCDETGQCPCRANVIGRRCDLCKEGSFALSADNPLGCFSCFCFGKSGQCEQSGMVWTEKNFPQREVYFVIGNTEVKSVLGFKLIPPEVTSVGVQNFGELHNPFYWPMPPEILKDQVASYNGYIRFRTYARGGGKLTEGLLRKFPLVVLQGNHRLILYHYGPEQLSTTGLYHIRFHESEWTLADNPEYPVTRDVLMVALQKVQHILVRSSDLTEANFVRISDVSLEVAILGGFSSRLATGVEQCRCPPQYTEPSCQDPNIGYYRKRKPNFLDSKDILDLVGWAEPCQCYNYSRICDKETGECLNCEGFTTGPHCNLCLRGYYGDPTRGIPCRKCACPTLVNSFSETCELLPGSNSEYVCTACQEGYVGRHCEQCADGYWGNPMAPDGRCIPCSCSPIGSLSNICDKRTGQCPCKEGITGHDCSNCPPRHVVTDTGCLNCDDQCTGLLLDDIEFLQSLLAEANLTDVQNLPWTRLMYLTKNLNRIKEQFNLFKNRVQWGKDMVNNFTINFDLETLADLLALQARDLIRKAPLEAERAHDTMIRAQNAKDLIADLLIMIQNIVNQLKRQDYDITDPFGTPSDRMFEEAQRILQELRHRDFGPDTRRGQVELKKALFLLEKVRQMLTDREHTQPMRERLEKLMRLLNEIYEMIQRKIFPESREAHQTVNRMRPTLHVIFNTLDNATRNANMANESLTEARELLDLIRHHLYDTKAKFGQLPALVAQMMNITDQIEQRRSILARINPEYEEKYVIPCQEHAEEMLRRVDELGRLFNQTRISAEDALRAARVYEQIAQAIAEAEEAVKNARKAAEKAWKEANPDHDPSLLEQAIESRRRSEELLNMANELNRRLADLQAELANKQHLLAEIEAMLEQGRRELERIKQALDGLPTDLTKDLQSIMERLRQLLGMLEQTHTRIDELTRRINDLRPLLDRIHAGTTAGLDSVKAEIDESLRKIKLLKEEIVKVESKVPGLDRLRNQLELNLNDLKMKIKLARQKAASIRISLGADRESTCIRTYEPELEPSFTNNIVMYYAIKHEHQRDSLLLFLGARQGQRYNNDFMALEMKDRKIRFVWNTGNAERMIQHPLQIMTNDAQLSKDSHWYKIEVKRFGAVANLSVLRVPDARTQDPFETSDSTNSEAKRMDLDRNSYFYIGGLPPDIAEPPRQLQSRNFAGCLYELYIDGRKVGLWNFTTNIGCDGCKEGATEPIDPTMYNFNDEFSYGRTTQISGYNKNTYLVSFRFRTFDENALLFFTSNPRTRDYVAIYLKDGRVHYECRFGRGAGRPGESQLISSQEQLNTGAWVQLRAERENDYAVLEINVDQKKNTYEKKINLPQTTLDLDRTAVYFGGVTPNFSTVEYPNVVFKSFVGCMNSPQIDTTPINLQRIQSFGIEPGCLDKPIRVASFRGDGFLELDGQTLNERTEFSFTFKTPRKSGILLLSTFEGQPRSYDLKDEHYYFFYISNGMLVVRLNGGSGENMYQFDSINVADGNYHTVTCIKDARRFRILVDDEHESPQIRLPKSRVIEAPTKGGFFIGGTPHGYSSVNKGYASSFYGVIRDIVFNSKLISFNNPTSFRGVGIGREGSFESPVASTYDGQLIAGGPTSLTSSLGFDDDRMIAMPAENYGQMNCASPHVSMMTRTESDAMKFGDRRPNSSYVQVDTIEHTFYNDFSLSFSFRTYYPNGVLFLLARHSTQQHHSKPVFAVSLIDGRVMLRMKMSERHYVELSSSAMRQLNDGQWHHVAAGRKKLSLWLTVDHKDRVENNKPKRRLALKKGIVAYIGGLPEQFDTNGQQYVENDLLVSRSLSGNFLPTTEGFKGCIKKFYLNEKHVDFNRMELPVGVGTCYMSIEKGAFFHGEQSFAIYDESFNIGLKADIAFEFRTTVRQAVLFSMSNGSVETSSLSIELTEDGGIVASADHGSGPFRARKTFATAYEMCDGRWHSVKVQYTKNSISLKVDRSEVVYGLSEHPLDNEPFTSAPLYVGGLPEFAPSGALLSRQSFHGCMRNIEVNDQRKDWLTDVTLFNVEPNACPAPAI